MEITPDQIIEDFVDALATGELGQSVDAFQFTRLGPGMLRLDYGDGGRFILTVEQEP
jgi:hypothetical protein